MSDNLIKKIRSTFMRTLPDIFQKEFCKKGVVRNLAKFTGKHLCKNLFFNKVADLRLNIKREALAQVFSCEFCEISKNTFSTEHLGTTASAFCAESLPGYSEMGLN